jgi:hypothetical protein
VEGINAVDLFSFNGTAGQAVTITASSSAFTPFLDLEVPVTYGSFATAYGTPAVLDATLDQAGSWTIGITNLGDSFQGGDYTLTFSCPGSAPPPNANCSPNSQTLCLASGRFKVTATYNAGSSGSGTAHVVSLTDDTGYLWFFDSTNVEAVVKVLNGCGLGGHYWFFAGGLTNVDVVMTVTDTQTGATKRYTNPTNTTFEPIQDTNAFSTCP